MYIELGGVLGILHVSALVMRLCDVCSCVAKLFDPWTMFLPSFFFSPPSKLVTWTT